MRGWPRYEEFCSIDEISENVERWQPFTIPCTCVDSRRYVLSWDRTGQVGTLLRKAIQSPSHQQCVPRFRLQRCRPLGLALRRPLSCAESSLPLSRSFPLSILSIRDRKRQCSGNTFVSFVFLSLPFSFNEF